MYKPKGLSKLVLIEEFSIEVASCPLLQVVSDVCYRQMWPLDFVCFSRPAFRQAERVREDVAVYSVIIKIQNKC